MNEDKRFEDVLAPLSMRVPDLRDLWLSTKRGKPGAISKLEALLVKHPELQPVIRHIETVSAAMRKKNKIKKAGKAAKPIKGPSTWGEFMEKTGNSKARVHPVQGGSPSLGKRK